jgi:hypothetical protein
MGLELSEDQHKDTRNGYFSGFLEDHMGVRDRLLIMKEELVGLNLDDEEKEFKLLAESEESEKDP